jgi:hypothetical protein
MLHLQTFLFLRKPYLRVDMDNHHQAFWFELTKRKSSLGGGGCPCQHVSIIFIEFFCMCSSTHNHHRWAAEWTPVINFITRINGDLNSSKSKGNSTLATNTAEANQSRYCCWLFWRIILIVSAHVVSELIPHQYFKWWIDCGSLHCYLCTDIQYMCVKLTW